MTSGAQPVRDATTVVLLRDGVDGVETWLLQRVAQLEFAAGMAVFPGGAVDAGDADLPSVTDHPHHVADGFGCSITLGRALVGGAVREVFEETGVLLTSPTAELSAAQPDVESGRVAFGELLRAHGLRVNADALWPWAHWITPAGRPRRYDTHFFVAALPPGAQAADLTSESTSAHWTSPRQALADQESGRLRLMPPTISVLTSIAGFHSSAQVIDAAAGRVVEVARPVLSEGCGSSRAGLPDASGIGSGIGGQ